jgi:hypothetical protein
MKNGEEQNEKEQEEQEIIIPESTRAKASIDSWRGYVSFSGPDISYLIPSIVNYVSEMLTKKTLLSLARKMKNKANITQLRQVSAICRKVRKKIKGKDDFLYKQIKEAMKEVSMFEILYTEMRSKWLSEREKGNVEYYDKLPETLV